MLDPFVIRFFNREYEMDLTYRDLPNRSWETILLDGPGPWRPPLTMHLPIQPAHSADFAHVDAALGATRRRVVPKLSVREAGPYEAAQMNPALRVNFALEDPPFIPDFNRTRLSLAEGRFPVVTAEYFAWDLLYVFEYACCEVRPGQTAMSIRCRITNEGESAQLACVRAKITLLPEKELDDYHYIPVYWDASKWKPCDKVDLRGDRLVTERREIGRVGAGTFKCELERNAIFDPKGFNKKWSFGTPYSATPPLRVLKSDRSVKFTRELAIGESAEFEIVLLVNDDGATDADRKWLASDRATSQNIRAAALDHFRAIVSSATGELTFPTSRWGDMFAEAQISNQQLLVHFPGEPGLMPTQGGTSERFFVWVWEVINMMLPMLRLGHTDATRAALDFVFSLQDGGYEPEGRLTSTKGSIGTTGPRWLSSTGAGLSAAAEYFLLTRDGAFLEEYLPRILRATDWLATEIRATRTLNLDGSRPLWYGLMPFGCATDGDIGYILSFTDAYSYRGLDHVAKLLAALKHPRAAEIATLRDDYRADLLTAIAGVSRPDGFIDRKIATGAPDEIIYAKLDLLCNVSHLAYCGVIDPREPMFQRFVTWIENNYADGFFLGRMDREVMYIGLNEQLFQEIYLRTNQWKKAFAALRANLSFGLTQDTFQVQERFSKLDAAYVPWQPNGSGNGRVLTMLINAIYFDRGDDVVLFGCIPFAYLRANGTTALRDLRTASGRISIEATMLDPDRCRVTLRADSPAALPQRVVWPDHFAVEAQDGSTLDRTWVIRRGRD